MLQIVRVLVFLLSSFIKRKRKSAPALPWCATATFRVAFPRECSPATAQGHICTKNVLLRHPAALVGSCLSYTCPLHQFGKVQLPLALPMTATLLMLSPGVRVELFLCNVSWAIAQVHKEGSIHGPRPSFSCFIKMKTKDSPGHAMGRCCCLLVLRPHVQFHLGCLL